MDILFFTFFLFFIFSLLLPFIVVVEILSLPNHSNKSVSIFPMPFVHLFFIIVLPLICTFMGDFNPLWEINIFLLIFGLLVSSYFLAYLLLVIINLIKIR